MAPPRYGGYRVIEGAMTLGTLVASPSRGSISAHHFDERLWYPGAMLGVVMDVDQPRERVHAVEFDGARVVRASPYPRLVPGVPPERNLNGISFAVANASRVLAALLAKRPDIVDAEAALEALASSGRHGSD